MKKQITLSLAAVSSLITLSASEKTFFNARTTEAGTLSEVIGGLTHQIDSLIVEGPVNAADLNTMWEETYYGRTTSLNLKNAIVEDGKIPDYAFWHQDVQMEIGSGYFQTILLQDIIMPDNVEEIGSFAFMYARHLKEVELPGALIKLGEGAFYECLHLETSPLILPEQLAEIGKQCFFNCVSLNEVVFPTDMDKIGFGAFWGAWIRSAAMPAEVNSIADYAFYGTRLKEATMPACADPGEYIFGNSYELEKLVVSDGVTDITKGFAENCIALKEILLPSSAETICDNAFGMCMSLTELLIPEGVRHVKENVFQDCYKLETICYPSTTASIATSTLRHPALKQIYCKAATPPALDINGAGENLSNIPVYVPKGCAGDYRLAPGWDYFTNFVETDDFPDASGVSAAYAGRTSVSVVSGGIVIEADGCATDYRIITSDGRNVATGTASLHTLIPLSPGIYIVTAGNETHKICVK